MIEPAAIPLFTGDLGQLEQHIDALRDESDGVRQAGGEAHRQFQGLSAFYEAPEAEDLFASTAPARDAADSFGDKLATVADALRTYAAEVAPIAKRLQHLQSQVATFVAGLKTSTGEIDDKWAKDADKVDEHRALLHDVNAAQHAFAAAEIACNNKITALVGGTQYVLNTGAKQFVPLGAQLYGYSTDVLDQAEELPWGTPVTQHHDWWDVDDFDYYLQHTVKSFVWDGLIVDNVWGTVDGILSMSGMNGEQAFKDTWSGLARVVVGAETYLMEAGGQEPEGIWATEFAQGSKVYAKEFGKSLVAWDMWSENPARASATVVFNVLTLGVGPLKVASVGKAGTTAKVAATVAKVGDAIDPISAAAKVSSQAVPKIAAVTEWLRSGYHIPEVRTPSSILEYADVSGRTVLVVKDGEFIVSRNGEVVSESPTREPAGAETTRAMAHVGDNASSNSGHGGARAGEGLPGHSSEAPNSTSGARTDESGPGRVVDHSGGAGTGGGSYVPDGPMEPYGNPADGGTEPRGNLPDGSWEGPQGLRLSPEVNAATGRFMDRAVATEPEITAALQGAVRHVEGGKLNGLDYRLKGEDSLKRKIATALHEDVRLTSERALGNIRDSLRYTVEIPGGEYSSGVIRTVDELHARGFENVTFKNTWENSGYKGINSTWRDPVTGQVFEVQFHTPESFTAKMDTHELYERGRLPGISSDELASVQAAQDDLFDRVPVPDGAGSIRLTQGPDPAESADARDVDPAGHGGEGPVRSNGPPRELTPEQRASYDVRLNGLEQQFRGDFDQLKHDPDHKGKVEPSEMDEARLALDLRESGRFPADIQRPPAANSGDFYSPSTGEFYEIKGVHSSWPPLNNARDKSLPFKGAYDPAKNERWVNKLEDQIVTKGRVVILDMRNANQAAIDDVRSVVEQHGWSDRVVWYP